MVDESQILSLVAEWEAARSRGVTIPLPELCANTPEFLPQVREALRKLYGDEIDWTVSLSPDAHTKSAADQNEITADAPDRQSEQTQPQIVSEWPANLPRLAGYAFEEEISRGGMGIVFLVRHLRLNRLAALKLMLNSDAKGVIRFLSEAEAVAAVRHPNVVQVYDSGQANGQPYLVMEYCSGGTLTELLKRKPKLSHSEAAGLIASIAEGVAAAHQVGIVHRDLKPGNILFDNDGVAKVGDFGLAKRGSGADLTQTQAIMGTPAYMSPEQASGGTKFVGPTSDVWSLGVILFECLTGQKPFQSDTVMALLDQVRSGTIPSVRSVSQGIPRELDQIVRKCLAKDAQDRYRTARELAEDLRNWLAGRPIQAKPARTWVIAWKWSRRNPAIVASLFFSMMVVCTAIGISLWYAERIRREGITPTQDASITTPTVTSPPASITNAVPVEPKQVGFDGLTEADTKRVAEWTSQIQKLEAQDNYQNAIGVAEEVLNFRSEKLGADHYSVATANQELIRLKRLDSQSESKRKEYRQAKVGLVEAETLAARPRNAEAQKMLEHAAKVFEELLGNESPEYARVLQELGRINRDRAYNGNAQKLVQQSIGIYRKCYGDWHPETASGLSSLAVMLEAMGRYAEAQPLHEKSLAIRRKVYPKVHPSLAVGLVNLARNYQLQARFAMAEPLFREALNIVQSVYGAEHPETSKVLTGLALNLKADGKFQEALPLLEKVCASQKKSLGENHPVIASSLNNLAGLYQSMGEYAQAKRLCVEALELFKKLGVGNQNPDYARSLNSLAELYFSMEDYAQAEPLFQESLAIRRRVLQPDHPDTATSYNNVALNLDAQGDAADAQPLFLKALDIRRQVLGEDHPDTATSYYSLAINLQAQGKADEAQPLLQKALDIRRQVLGENHPDYATSLMALAKLYQTKKEFVKAEPLLLQVRDLCQNLLGENHPNTSKAYYQLAVLYLQQNKLDQARAELWNAVTRFEASRLARASGFDRSLGESYQPRLLLASLEQKRSPSAGWEQLEASLARSFLDLKSDREQSQLLNPAETAELGRLNAKLAELKGDTTQLLQLPNRSVSENNLLKAKLDLQQEYQQQLTRLAIAASTRSLSSREQVQTALPDNTALLMWLDVSDLGVEEHWACVLTKKRDPYWIQLPASGDQGQWTKDDAQLPFKVRKHLAHEVVDPNERNNTSFPRPLDDGDDTWKKGLQRGNSEVLEPNRLLPGSLPELIQQLRRQRIEPVLAHLKEQGITQLAIVGVNDMAGIPVEVLAPEFAISYVPSGTFLARLPKKPKYENTLLAVGDPIYEVEKAKQEQGTPLPPHGLLIEKLAPGGVAERMGLQPGDVLLNYGNTKIVKQDQLYTAIQQAAASGDKTASVTVWRLVDATKVTETTLKFPIGPLGVILAKEPAPIAIAERRKVEKIFGSQSRGEITIKERIRVERWPDLPGTRIETVRIAELFASPKVLLGGQASERSVDALRVSGELSKFRYLHFATHGKTNPLYAFESKIILSQDQQERDLKAGEPWLNNEISAREVLDFWKLNADLVTLSACQTGLGRQGGGDGLLGFPQAFLLSGARSVCVSLWEVDDTATTLLMLRFYQNLLGKRPGLTAPLPKAFALKEAKEWLRNLTSEEALTVTTSLVDGVARGEKKFWKPRQPEGFATVTGAAIHCYEAREAIERARRNQVREMERIREMERKQKPYADPHYWSAFILIGASE